MGGEIKRYADGNWYQGKPQETYASDQAETIAKEIVRLNKTTIIYACGCIRKIETDKPMTKEQWKAEKEQRCPACRLHEPQNVFGYGGDVKAGGLQ
jgi:predicted SprT family Zn-dependent metalloprotease